MGFLKKLFGETSDDKTQEIRACARSGIDDDLVRLARIVREAAAVDDMNTLRTVRSELKAHVDITRFANVIRTRLSMEEQNAILSALRRVGW
jgi:hypothetical protein